MSPTVTIGVQRKPGGSVGTMSIDSPWGFGRAGGGRQVGVGAAGEPDQVCLVGTRGEDLATVDDPLVTVQPRRGAQRREVGAGLRLGVADGDVQLAGEDARKVRRLLLLRPEAHE